MLPIRIGGIVYASTWCFVGDLNPEPSRYEQDTLPVEITKQDTTEHTIKSLCATFAVLTLNSQIFHHCVDAPVHTRATLIQCAKRHLLSHTLCMFVIISTSTRGVDYPQFSPSIQKISCLFFISDVRIPH